MAGTIAYANSLSLGFVFDDFPAIVENEQIRHLWPFAPSPTQSQTALAGRPIAALSLALNFALGGLSPSGYHAWNLIVHVACALVLFGILRRTSAFCAAFGKYGDVAACGVSLVWLVHPLTSEVVDYVTQRTESMMGLSALLTLYCSIRASPPGAASSFWTIAAIVACGCGMATKESMVTIPVIVCLYDLGTSTMPVRERLQRRWRLYAGLSSTWLILAWLNAGGPRSRSAGFASGESPVNYLFNQALMIVTYLERTFWPTNLVMDYGVPRTLLFTDVWPQAVAIVALAAMAVLLWLRTRAGGFVATSFFLLLAPTSSIVPIATEAGAERRMYLPLICLVVLTACAASYGLTEVARRFAWNDRTSATARRVTIAGVAALCATLLTVTMARNREYRSEASIWQTVVDRRPHGRAHYNLGLALAAAGERERAREHYRLAAADWPPAHYAVAFELQKDGQHEAAIREYRTFIQLKPEDYQVPRAHLQIARASVALGRSTDAESSFTESLRMTPGNADARGELAELLREQKRFDEAIEHYDLYLRLQPASAPAHHNLALILAEMNRLPEAIDHFRQAASLQPSDLDIRENLARALASNGHLDDAANELRAVVRVAPDRATTHALLGNVLAALGRREEAESHFKSAMALEQPR